MFKYLRFLVWVVATEIIPSLWKRATRRGEATPAVRSGKYATAWTSGLSLGGREDRRNDEGGRKVRWILRAVFSVHILAGLFLTGGLPPGAIGDGAPANRLPLWRFCREGTSLSLIPDSQDAIPALGTPDMTDRAFGLHMLSDFHKTMAFVSVVLVLPHPWLLTFGGPHWNWIFGRNFSF